MAIQWIGYVLALVAFSSWGANSSKPAVRTASEAHGQEEPKLKRHQLPTERPVALQISSMDEVPDSVKSLLDDLESDRYVIRRSAQIALAKAVTNPKSLPHLRDLAHLEAILNYVNKTTSLPETRKSVQGVLAEVDAYLLREVPYCEAKHKTENGLDQGPKTTKKPTDAVVAPRDEKWFTYFESVLEIGYGESCSAAVRELEDKYSKYRLMHLHTKPILGLGGAPEPIEESEDGRTLFPKVDDLKGRIGCCKLGPRGPFQTNEVEFVVRRAKTLNEMQGRAAQTEFLQRFAKKEGAYLITSDSRKELDKKQEEIFRQDKEEVISVYEFGARGDKGEWHAIMVRPIDSARRESLERLRKIRKEEK